MPHTAQMDMYQDTPAFFENVDVEIGAVEIKNGTSDLRAEVATVAGVNRLRVESVGPGGGALLNTVTFAGPAFATIGVASGVLIAANAARKALIVVVTTPGRRISLGFGVAAVLDSGITLVTAQPLVLDVSMLSTQAINAIANAAGTNVAIQEGT